MSHLFLGTWGRGLPRPRSGGFIMGDSEVLAAGCGEVKGSLLVS